MKIEVQSRRWFQKTYGNTYHSMTLYIDDIEVSKVPFEYGYGSQHEQTALDEFKKLYPEIVKKADEKAGYQVKIISALSRYTDIKTLINVIDVKNKKDL